MIGYYFSLHRQITDIEDAHCMFSIHKIPKPEKKLILEFSRGEGDYDHWSDKKKREMSFNSRAEDWMTPNVNLMAQLLLFHQEYSAVGGSYGRLHECHNLWIVKPASNARGQGIYVTDKLEGVDSGETVGKDSLVQKYIECPLLLQLAGKEYKFDIRQWVLVSSLQPLTIHIFSGFYCRLCSSPYDLSQIGDTSKHLTNYSVNKGNFSGNLKSSVLDDTFLKTYLREKSGVNWEECLQPKIEAIITQTLQAGAVRMKPRDRSFEIYGFDILLDSQLCPYLLEVNLSPACEEREDFLAKMLSDMTLGLFQILRDKEKLAASRVATNIPVLGREN